MNKVLLLFMLSFFGLKSILAQDIVTCREQAKAIISNENFDAFAKAITFNDEYWELPIGVQIHGSCVDQYESNIAQYVTESYEQGLACLKNLFPGKGAVKNYALMSKLLSSKKLKFICHEKDYHWDEAVAHSALSPEQNLKELKVDYPYISFSPTYKEGGSNYTTVEEFKSTIFHETFHSIGYSHLKDQEYAFACEQCCFINKGHLQKVACDLCANDYGDFGNGEYIKNLAPFKKYNDYKNTLKLHKITRLGLLINPGSKEHLKVLMEEDSEESLVSQLMAKDLRFKFMRDAKIKELAKKEIPKSFDAILPTVKHVVEARHVLYVKGDFKKAVEYYKLLNEDEFLAYQPIGSYNYEKNYLVSIIDAITYDYDLLIYKLDEADPDYNILVKKRNDFLQIWETIKIDPKKAPAKVNSEQ